MARNEESSSRQGEAGFPDEPLFREMMRENERILDRQHESLVRADEKNIFAFKLTVLSLVLGLSLAAYRLQASRDVDMYIDVALGIAFMIGTVCHVSTFILLGQSLFSLAGDREKFTEAPREDWILSKLKDPGHDLDNHFSAVIQGLARAIQRNEEWLTRGVFLRRKALRILIVGFLSYVLSATVIYIARI